MLTQEVEPTHTIRYRFRELQSDARHNSLSILGAVGSSAPFFGLIGVVVGVQEALSAIGASDPKSVEALMQGISTALYSVAYALFVAIALLVLQRELRSAEEKEGVDRRPVTPPVAALRDPSEFETVTLASHVAMLGAEIARRYPVGADSGEGLAK